MGFFGGPHKTVKELDNQLMAARMSLEVYDRLPESNRAIAREKIDTMVAAAASAAFRAGHGDDAVKVLRSTAGCLNPSATFLRQSSKRGTIIKLPLAGDEGLRQLSLR